jgi:hypothetical protein
MLGIAGTVGLGAALLAELGRRAEPWASRAAVAAGALVLAAAAFTVAEYETDVPQFDELWYLPVLGLGAAFALSLVGLASARPYAATAAAALYTLFMLAVGGFLELAGFPPPALPLLLPAALAIDLGRRRRLVPPLTGLLFTAALYLAYVPVRNGLGDGVRIDLADVAIGAPLTWAAATAVLALAGGTPARPPRAMRPVIASGAALAALLVLAAPAAAHDPGQGDDAGTLAMKATANAREVRLAAVVPRSLCATTRARSLVARRAGEELRAPLRRRGCRLAGTVRVSGRGRWFVYAELEREGKRVESWLPVPVGDGRAAVSDRARYAYVPPAGSSGAAEPAGGVVLYAAMLALLCMTAALVRGAQRPDATTSVPTRSKVSSPAGVNRTG